MQKYINHDRVQTDLNILRIVIDEVEHWKRYRANSYLETSTLTNALVFLRDHREVLKELLGESQ